LLAGQTSEIMDVEMLHQMTGISRSAIYQKTCSRRGQPPELPHFKRGKRVYFRRSEILTWLMEHRVKNREEIEQEADEYCDDRTSDDRLSHRRAARARSGYAAS
jgi:predicted DNA-binding transcriptional regulator AlpA